MSNQKKWKMYVYKDLQANTSSLQTGNKPLTDKWINCAIFTKCNTNLTKTKCIPKRRGLKLYFSTSKKDCGKIKVLPAWGKCISTQRCTVDDTMHYLSYNFLPIHHYGTILHWQIIEREKIRWSQYCTPRMQKQCWQWRAAEYATPKHNCRSSSTCHHN